MALIKNLTEFVSPLGKDVPFPPFVGSQDDEEVLYDRAKRMWDEIKDDCDDPDRGMFYFLIPKLRSTPKARNINDSYVVKIAREQGH